MRVKAWGHEPESPCGNKSTKSETPELREGWREPHCGQELLIFLDKSIMMWNRSHAAHRVRGSFSCDFSWRDRFECKRFFWWKRVDTFGRDVRRCDLLDLFAFRKAWWNRSNWAGRPKQSTIVTEKLISLGKLDSSLHDMSCMSVCWLDTHTKKPYRDLKGMPRQQRLFWPDLP